MEPAEHDEEPVVLPAALCCAAAVGLQVVLPRLFSVLLWYHLAFLAVSLAALGFAAAGAWVARNGPVAPRTACALAGLLLPLSAALALRVPLDLSDPGVLLDTLAAPLELLLMALLLALPFMALGLATAGALVARRERPSLLWGATFLGGAAGAGLALLAMEYLGAPRALLLLALPPLLGALWPVPGRPASRAALACALAAAGLCGLGLRTPDDVLPLVSRKHFPRIAPEQVRHEKWNAFSRVTFYDNPERHGLWAIPQTYLGPRPDSVGVVIDSWAITSILKRAPGEDADPVLPYYPPTLAYEGAPPGFTALVIGAGGGIDVQAALAAGASRVTAVEINPLIVDEVRGPSAEWCGHLYDDPRVEVIVAEGRHFLSTADEPSGAPRTWDRIVLSGVDTFAATQAGAFALSENYLYTVEALRSLLDHLTPHGAVFFTRWWFEPPTQTLRLALTAASVLRERGVAEPLRRLFIARTATNPDAVGENSLLILTASDLQADDVTALARAAARRGCVVECSPFTPSHPVFAEALTTPNLPGFLARYPYRVEPSTDDRPFFFEHGRLTNLFRGEGDWIRDRLGGQELLVATLLLLLLLGAPLLLAAPRPPGAPGFACLGAGYMLVEVAEMQRLSLLLGHPIHAVAVVLVSLLIFSGCGALLSARMADGRARLAALLAAAAIAAVLAGGRLDALVSAPFSLRLLSVAALLLPAALAMGLPFPLAARGLSAADVAGAFLWNGVAAVVAGPIAVLLALHVGFTGTVLVGAIAYFAAAAWLPRGGAR